MVQKSWKTVERRIARFFGTERNPLSGRNSKHTASDTLHSKYYIEVKHRKTWAVFNLFNLVRNLASEEHKIPILALQEKNKKGFLICVHSDHWEYIVDAEYRRLFS